VGRQTVLQNRSGKASRPAVLDIAQLACHALSGPTRLPCHVRPVAYREAGPRCWNKRADSCADRTCVDWISCLEADRRQPDACDMPEGKMLQRMVGGVLAGSLTVPLDMTTPATEDRVPLATIHSACCTNCPGCLLHLIAGVAIKTGVATKQSTYLSARSAKPSSLSRSAWRWRSSTSSCWYPDGRGQPD
jgi:hypothetical protein